MEIPSLVGISVEDLLSQAPRVRQRAAGFLVGWGHYAQALPILERLAAGQEDGVLYRAWLGQCLIGLGLRERAAAVIESLCADHPASLLAQCARVDLLLALGDRSAAFAACQDLFRPPVGERSVAWWKMAAYCLASGEVSQARACCARAQALFQERAGKDENAAPSGAFLRLLAQVHTACGDDAAAAAAQQECARREAEEAGVVAALLRSQPAPTSLSGSRGGHAGTLQGASLEESDASSSRGRTVSDGYDVATERSDPVSPSLSVPALSQSGADPGVPADALRPQMRRVLGHEDFLPGQREVLGRVLAGQDVLALLPTGGGKSLCYQLLAAQSPQVVVVISPLIALMRDQLQGVPPSLLGRTTVVNSSVGGSENEARLNGIVRGRYHLVYAAPERLRQWPFLHALRRAGVSLFVVDEAHCISLWGHDFRPDYFFIGPALAHLGQPPLLALTATASPRVQDEIGTRLGRSLARVDAGVARPNLRLEVVGCGDDSAKLPLLLDLLREEPGASIVYVRSRQGCEEAAGFLSAHEIPALFYHAGMDAAARDEAQAGFMAGRARVVCATVAFGMGIDKEDVRLIAHLNLPKSVENYWQEAGRAGRDGLPARCVLFSSKADQGRLWHWLRRETPSASLLHALHAAVAALLRIENPARVILDDLARAVGTEEQAIRVALGLLERLGLVERFVDLPRTFSLCPAARGDPAFQAFLGGARLRPGQRVDLDSLELSRRTGIPPTELEGRLLEWRDAGWLQVRSSGRDVLLALPPAPADADRRIAGLLAECQVRQEERAAQMIRYAGRAGCRHRFVARVFGQSATDRCRSCDVCLPAAPGARPAPAPMVGGERLAADGAGDARADGWQASDGAGRGQPLREDPCVPAADCEPAAGTAGGEPTQEEVIGRLRAWRLQAARERGVPAFVIFHDSVLRSLAAERPRTLAGLLRVRGIGLWKAAHYGAAILALLREEE